MGLFKKARTGTGWFIQVIGGLIWIGCGIWVLIWTLNVLFDTIGVWTIFVGLLFAPFTYLASILIVWFTSDNFPFLILIPYFASFIGIGIIALGGAIKGEERSETMIDHIVKQKLTIKPTEALYGTKKLIARKGKRLEVIIPPGVKTGTLVKLSGALQITDGYYGDLFIQINVKNTRRIVYAVSAIAVLFIIISSIVITRNITTSTDNSYTVSYNGYMTIFNNKQPDDFQNNGKPVQLINNENAVDPTWKELKAFLFLDKTDQKPYIDYSYECASFAEELHNNAEARGIRAAFVGIFFSSEFEGHALNAFQTTDKGLVYIDCQGYDFVAYIAEDKEYGIILLEMAESFSYNYFIDYNDEFKATPLGIVDLVYIYW